MGYSAWFQCIKGCSEKYPLDDVIYQCRNCGALLEVVHDMGELKKKSAREWMDTFDDRIHKNLWPYGSGVWGKKEWICPNIDNENVVSLYEGNTNLFWAERFGKDIGLENLWIKMCGNRRYISGACHILCGGRHPVYCIPAEGEGFYRPAYPAYSKRLTRIIT